MPIDDARLHYQEEAITHLVARWAEKGQIPNFNTYAATLRRWLGTLSGGHPLTTGMPVLPEDLTELDDLVTFMTRVLVDLEAQEREASVVLDAIKSQQGELASTVKGWNTSLNHLASILEGLKKQHRTRYGISYTEPFTRSESGIYTGTTVNPVSGTLEIAPLRESVVFTSPASVVLRAHPIHNPRGGVTHLPKEYNPPPMAYMADGIDLTVATDGVPIVRIDDRDWPGIVVCVELTYQTPVSFNTMEIVTRTPFPVHLIRAQVRCYDNENWDDILLANTRVVNTTTNDLVVRSIPAQSVTSVRLFLNQQHAVIRNPETITPEYTDDLSIIEGEPPAPIPVHSRRYRMAIAPIKLVDRQYGPLSKGKYRSHAEGDGYSLPQKPIGAVELESIHHISTPSAMSWYLDTSDQNISIPILPKGVDRVTEVAIFAPGHADSLTGNELYTMFPVEQGTTQNLYVNGTLVTGQTGGPSVGMSSSRRLVITGMQWRTGDRVLVEYTPARDNAALVYVIKTPGNAVTFAELDNMTTEQIVGASRRAIDRIIQKYGSTEMESRAVLARLDEFDYWFFGGTQDINLGRTMIPIPPIIDHTERPYA